jgi:hypothetical protein
MSNWRIGVRIDDSRAKEVLVGELGDVLVPDPSPPPGYSISSTTRQHRGSARPIPALSHGSCALIRSRSVQRLAVALANHVRVFDDRPGHVVRAASGAIIRAGRAALVPGRILWAAGLEPRLKAAGVTVVDAPAIEIDPRASVVKGRGWSWSAMSAVDAAATITDWFVESRLFEPFPTSRAGAVAAAAQLILPELDGDAQMGLDFVAQLATTVPPTPIEPMPAHDVWRRLSEIRTRGPA